MLHATNPRPAPGDLEQGLLNEVLGLAEIPDDQVRGPQQRVSTGGDEALEIGAAFVHLPRLRRHRDEKVAWRRLTAA